MDEETEVTEDEFEFTFQYGSNQMSHLLQIYKYINKFTLQYGSNQIASATPAISTAVAFTFQYGSNQFVCCECEVNRICYIYIPIWF